MDTSNPVVISLIVLASVLTGFGIGHDSAAKNSDSGRIVTVGIENNSSHCIARTFTGGILRIEDCK